MTVKTVDIPPPVGATPAAQVVANAFVEQYYHILHHSPELVYRFYQDSSVLSRQDDNGHMTSVTTMQGINAKILSLDFKSFKAEIETADAQESYKDGVILLVTGCLTGKDNLRKKFAQSFFLAPQAKGYFVLNDVFRYVDEKRPLDANAITVEKVDDSRSAEALHVDDASGEAMTPKNENNEIHIEESFQTSQKEMQVGTKGEEVSTVGQSTEHHIPESSQSSSLEDGVKNSYASIVKNTKGGPSPGHGPMKIYVPTKAVRSNHANTHKQSPALVPPAPDGSPSAPAVSQAPENVNVHEEAEGHSIYVRNLPLHVTVTELDQEFKRFGAIKQGGVQVRSNRPHVSCYGFVEFLSASSMESAIQASPMTIGGRQAFVEIKRTTTRVDGGGRFSSGMGGFRGESFRGRGGYGGGRGLSRNEFGGRGEFSGRGRPAGRGGEGYQRGRGRGRASRVMNRNRGAS